MHRSTWIASLGFVVAGCAIGAPPGFSKGETWTLPLVDPLADSKLVTPVYIGDRGPFLFAIDPDAPETMVDRELAVDLPFSLHDAGRLADEQDVTHPVFSKTLLAFRVGDLTISQVRVVVGRDHAFDSSGRRIVGVLGRDVIADSLVFSFDRDRGVATLTTQEAFHPPAGAQVIPYTKGTRQTGGPTVRRLVTATVDGFAFDLHLDLGDVPNQLWRGHWASAHLAPLPATATLVDETGTRRTATTVAIASRVTAEGLTRERIAFIPYDDRRWMPGQLDGTLGLDFFQPFAVAADWHHMRYYLTPRQPAEAHVADRLARWGTSLTGRCQITGCVSVTATRQVEPPGSEVGMTPMHDRAAPLAAVARVTRDPAASGVALEVVLSATSSAGAPLPLVYVDLPAGVDTFAASIEPGYANATFEVADLSPFPRPCVHGCVATHVSR